MFITLDSRHYAIEKKCTSLSFENFNYLCNVSHKYAFVFFALPKNGCSTLLHSLQQAELEKIFYQDLPAVHQSNFIKPFQVADFDHILEKYSTFCFVRNPYTRVLSAYLDKVASKQAYYTLPLQKALSLHPDQDLTFGTFVDALSLLPDSCLDLHFTSQYALTCYDTIAYKFIGRFEHFDQDTYILFETLGLDPKYISRKEEHKTGAISLVQQYYTKEIQDKVALRFAKDFETFEYDLDLPQFSCFVSQDITPQIQRDNTDKEYYCEALQEFLSTWLKGVDSEIHFWQHIFITKGGQWRQDFSHRTAAVPKLLYPIFTDIAKNPRILDVGAGPISKVGIASEHGRVYLEACDPLAELYAALLAQFDIAPYVKTNYAMVERLLDVYTPETYDVVSMFNALDHTFDAITGIKNLLCIPRIDGLLYLEHFENEATYGKFDGFHQWDICEKNGHLYIERGTLSFNVTEYCKNFAFIDLQTQDIDDGKRRAITAKIHKFAPAPIFYNPYRSVYDAVLSNVCMYQSSQVYKTFTNVMSYLKK